MASGKLLSSTGTLFVVVLLTVLLSFFLLLAFSQMGMVEFTGGGWLIDSFNVITGYLGTSVLFFAPTLIGFGLFFMRLRSALVRSKDDPNEAENVRFYNQGLDMFITIFFAIGVLFTAWGLQNALVSALGNLSEEAAGRLGAWEILKRLVDCGILIALWTTIVGGAGGYIMRLVKFIFLGRELGRFSSRNSMRDKKVFFDALEGIRSDVEKISARGQTNHSERSDQDVLGQ